MNKDALLLVYMLALSYKNRNKLNNIGFEATLEIKDRASMHKLFEKQALCLRQHCLRSTDPNKPGPKLPLTISQLETHFARTQDVIDVFTSAVEMVPPLHCEQLSSTGYVCEEEGGRRRVTPRHDTDDGARLVKVSQDLTKSIKCKTCKKGCTSNRCICHSKGIRCSDACGCNGCMNEKDKPITSIEDGVCGVTHDEDSDNQSVDLANDDDESDDGGMNAGFEEPDRVDSFLQHSDEDEKNASDGEDAEDSGAVSDDELMDGMSIAQIRDVLRRGKDTSEGN